MTTNGLRLIGSYGSPFVRRVGVTLKWHGLPFEVVPLSTGSDRAAIQAINPTGRIPALVLGSGEVLVDSTAIVDYLDEGVGPGRALLPASGPARRRAQWVIGMAMAALDKYVAAYYETRRRPETHVWEPWLSFLNSQVVAGLDAIDVALGSDAHFVGDTLSHADIIAVIAIDAVRYDQPKNAPAGRFPNLERLSATWSEHPAFRETRPVG